MQADRIEDYLQRLTPVARGSLLTELERLEGCGSEMPGSAEILLKLRAEFRKDGSAQNRRDNPSRRWSRCSLTALPSTPIQAASCAVRCLRSGSGSAGICCRR
jgi:hypothetical protein